MGVTIQGSSGKSFTIVNVYNPPNTNAGLKDLEHWLPSAQNTQLPMCIFMDANLDHRMWNPIGYLSTHRESTSLISLCGKNGFRIASPRHVTFYTSNGKGTTIDLIWENLKASKLLTGVRVSEENFGSDHQALKGVLCVTGFTPPKHWARPKWNELDQSEVCNMFNTQLGDEPHGLGVEDTVKYLSNALYSTQKDLGRTVLANVLRTKSWWDSRVPPVLKTRNRARQWMLLAKSKEACQCYKEWNEYFRSLVNNAKLNHWRKFLESSDRDVAFNALRRIRPVASGQILPLKRTDGSFAVGKAEQAKMLFDGTSIIHTQVDLSDVDPIEECCLAVYDEISEVDVSQALSKLAIRKAPGPDQILNETLKLTGPILQAHLARLFNRILSQGSYPPCWKNATTAIIRKAHKPSYTTPGAYRPIALLNTLGKTLEMVLARRLAEWPTISGCLPVWHYGGRKGVGTEDAIFYLDTWTRN